MDQVRGLLLKFSRFALRSSLFALFGIWVSFVTSQAQATKISEIEVSGNVRSDKTLILAACGLSSGNELSVEDVQDAIRRLYSLGIFSDIRVLAEQAKDGVKLNIVVEEFPVLEKVTFRGNEEFKATELEGKLGFVEGQVISQKAIRDAQRKILSLYKDKGYLLAEVKPETFQSDEEGKVILNFRVQEGKKIHVKEINIYGNDAFDDVKIKKQMETKEARWWRKGEFKEKTFREDLVKIIDFYKKRGFRDAKVTKDSLYYDSSMRDLFIDITLSEGIRYRFGKINWEGNELFSDQELAEKITIEQGDVYSQEKFDQTLYNLSTAYHERGYLSTAVIPTETSVGNQININFKIKEGNPSKVRKVIITGNTKTKEKVIRRELSVKPGQVFKRSALERSIRDVYQLNFFKNIEPKVEPLENGDVDLIVKVEEQSTGKAMMGVGYSQRDKLVGSIGLNIPNLFGNGQTLDFAWDFGTTRETFRLGFTEPWLFDTPTSGSLTIYKTTDKWEDNYDEKRQGGYLRIGKRLTWPDNYSRIYLRYRLEEVEYLNFSESFSDSLGNNPLGLKENEPQIGSSMSLTYLRDSRDMPQFPTTGSILSYTAELAGGPLHGDENYHKHILESDFYFPAFWKVVLMFKTKLGAVDAFSSGKQVPPGEKFRPGGTSLDGMIRGYDNWSVGPKEGKTHIGGKTMWVSTVELQVPIVYQQIYGLVFADAGHAWRGVSKTSPFDLKRSAGVGVRVVVPMMGMIGFDFAYGFDNEPDKWRPHFQFGTSF